MKNYVWCDYCEKDIDPDDLEWKHGDCALCPYCDNEIEL